MLHYKDMARTKKALQAGFITVGVTAALAGTVYGGMALTREQTQSRQPQQACAVPPKRTYEVIIRRGAATPAHTSAQRCDTLTILNQDATVRLIAFGVHDKHQTYDGVGEKVLKQGQSLTVTLVQPGDFKFHDHIHDEVQGTFHVDQ